MLRYERQDIIQRFAFIQLAIVILVSIFFDEWIVIPIIPQLFISRLSMEDYHDTEIECFFFSRMPTPAYKHTHTHTPNINKVFH